jgi:hypothetical protein
VVAVVPAVLAVPVVVVVTREGVGGYEVREEEEEEGEEGWDVHFSLRLFEENRVGWEGGCVGIGRRGNERRY